jgi:oligoendopeptidase F
MNLPDLHTFMSLPWEEISPYYQDLLEKNLSEENLSVWMETWSRLRELVDETYARLQLANALDTSDQEAEDRYHSFLAGVYTRVQTEDQRLKQKLLQSGLIPDGMDVPLKRMRAEADLFRAENLPLLTEERKLGSAYNKILGAQTVEWAGEELTLAQLWSRMQTPARDTRKTLWRLLAQRQLEDREAINELWEKLMALRADLAENAGKPDYRAYRWQQLLRLDYTPADSKRFVDAVEEVVVPAATRTYERYQDRMGLDDLRPWDLLYNQVTMNLPAQKAYDTVEEFISRVEHIFGKIHPRLGRYFSTMRDQELLDLENRKGKAPGAFCTSFAVEKVPFIFMNAVGLDTDVRTLFHESGHAFHVFERTQLPYHHQWRAGLEFAEVASTAMELFAAPYVENSRGGFFEEEDAQRFRRQHLEGKLLFWPYMAVVVAFQHWVYEHHDRASDPAQCDRVWGEYMERFMPSIQWDGFETVKETGWQRKLHIHRYPFYYIEYGLSQLGAVQIWANALEDQKKALEDYLAALAMGGTATLPELYQAAGATFAFDAETLKPAVDLMEETLTEL